MSDDERSSGLSWRTQAMLWPAICTPCTLAALALYAIIFRDGVRHSPGLAGSVAWIIVFVPIIVVVCSVVFGGIAIAAGVLVRSAFRLFGPGTSLVPRAVVLAVVTGGCAASVVIGFFALLGQSWAVADAEYGYSAVIGAVAGVASVTYARRLFDRTELGPVSDIN